MYVTKTNISLNIFLLALSNWGSSVYYIKISKQSLLEKGQASYKWYNEKATEHMFICFSAYEKTCQSKRQLAETKNTCHFFRH